MDLNPYRPPSAESSIEPAAPSAWWKLLHKTGMLFAGLLVLGVLWLLPVGSLGGRTLIGLLGWALTVEHPNKRSLAYFFFAAEFVPTWGMIPTLAATGFLGFSLWKFWRQQS